MFSILTNLIHLLPSGLPLPLLRNKSTPSRVIYINIERRKLLRSLPVSVRPYQGKEFYFRQFFFQKHDDMKWTLVHLKKKCIISVKS